MGLGCWAIGGPWAWSDGRSMGWGEVDDEVSIRAIHRALDLGINFFDTAANYGAGHSERVLGRALAGRRDEVVIATKFGHLVDEARRVVDGSDDLIIENVRRDCEAGLRRLNTDVIDIYQLHEGDYDPGAAVALREVLEELVREGKIRWYGWSTDSVARARVFAEGEHCATVQHRLNILNPAAEMLRLCAEHDLASINKSPLASGLLTGKYSAETKIADEQQWRSRVDFGAERIVDLFAKLEAMRAVLTRNGHTLPQAAIAWNWAYDERTVPIPGFRTPDQVEENAGALELGPLSPEQMAEVAAILSDG